MRIIRGRSRCEDKKSAQIAAARSVALVENLYSERSLFAFQKRVCYGVSYQCGTPQRKGVGHEGLAILSSVTR